jgi:hypothetical protein
VFQEEASQTANQVIRSFGGRRQPAKKKPARQPADMCMAYQMVDLATRESEVFGDRRGLREEREREREREREKEREIERERERKITPHAYTHS